MTAKPAIEKMKSVANVNHLIAKAASRAKRKTLARARIAAADLLREEMMLPAMWQYPSRLPTEARRRTRKKNTISFPSWNGAAARAESPARSLEKAGKKQEAQQAEGCTRTGSEKL